MVSTGSEASGVSQSRVKLLQSHYFKHTTSSSAAEVLFQSPVYLEIYRAWRTPFGEISSVHMSRLRGLKIPTMLCALASEARCSADMCYQASVLAIEKHPSFVIDDVTGPKRYKPRYMLHKKLQGLLDTRSEASAQYVTSLLPRAPWFPSTYSPGFGNVKLFLVFCCHQLWKIKLAFCYLTF